MLFRNGTESRGEEALVSSISGASHRLAEEIYVLFEIMDRDNVGKVFPFSSWASIYGQFRGWRVLKKGGKEGRVGEIGLCHNSFHSLGTSWYDIYQTKNKKTGIRCLLFRTEQYPMIKKHAFYYISWYFGKSRSLFNPS